MQALYRTCVMLDTLSDTRLTVAILLNAETKGVIEQ